MRVRSFLIAGVLALGATAPAMAADWDKIDQVVIERGADRDSTSPQFGGPVERLRFTARESGVQCSAITAVFANGTKARLFTGKIAAGSSKVVDLPGSQRRIDKLNFRCHALTRAGGRLVVEADVGQYRSAWRSGPRWSFWSNVFGSYWDQQVNYWVYVGKQSFTGMHDNEAMFTGWGGKSVTTIGLKPVNDDARCSRAIVTFGNGRTATLPIDGGATMREDRTYSLDLPGQDRDVVKLALRCRAEHMRSVTVNIYMKK